MSQAVSMSPILQMRKLSKLVLEPGFNLSFSVPKVYAPSSHCAVINSHLKIDRWTWSIILGDKLIYKESAKDRE